jgi:threonine dehydrogenase-like Zn-dependent dehydrogenase
MGIDFDGAFADHVVVPECQVRLIPSDLSFDLAVYAEPIAATRAVLQPLQGVDEPILIYGTGRIARLTEYILTTAGHGDVTASTGPGDQRFGCIIEAADSGTKITDAVGALSPGGRLILKSRHPENLSLPLLPAVKNRIKVEAVYHSQFDEALDFLGEHREFISSLLGNSWPLESCREAFAEASASEGLKTIFAIAD